MYEILQTLRQGCRQQSHLVYRLFQNVVVGRVPIPYQYCQLPQVILIARRNEPLQTTPDSCEVFRGEPEDHNSPFGA